MSYTVGDVLQRALQEDRISYSRFIDGIKEFDVNDEIWGQPPDYQGITFIDMCKLLLFLNEENKDGRK